ncbi:MAG: terminase family protein [Desulfobacteraceae bacterium]|nr:terminase family protein [Desulfobacteraceae bacterium]
MASKGSRKRKTPVRKPTDAERREDKAEYAAKQEAVPLYTYQKQWVMDASRFKIGLWSRQTGKSFSTSLEAVLDCDEHKTDWVFLSSGERQSKELIRKARDHARALDTAYSDAYADYYTPGSGATFKQLEMEFRNGSRILALPANADTARGHSANVVLDEFAFHQDSIAIWKSLFPTITRGYKLRIISTPQGRKNKFYQLWTGNPRYVKYKVDIWSAFEQGLKIVGDDGEAATPEFLREALDDEEAWRQEYLCEFVDEATAFIPYELIVAAEDVRLTDENVLFLLERGDIFAGIDIGRKRDVTVYWSFKKIGDVLWSHRKIEHQNMPYTLQFDSLCNHIDMDHPRRVCVDATGLGGQLAEDLHRKYGSRVEPILFRNSVKEDLATSTKRTFEDRRIRIPVDRKVREDIHNVKKLVTAAGNTRFDAERTKDGHSDRFWALALSVHAAGKFGHGGAIVTVGAARESVEAYKKY